ncbi:hypothetical protein pdam_00020550, partial [Pocillopora damicornis]
SESDPFQFAILIQRRFALNSPHERLEGEGKLQHTSVDIPLSPVRHLLRNGYSNLPAGCNHRRCTPTLPVRICSPTKIPGLASQYDDQRKGRETKSLGQMAERKETPINRRVIQVSRNQTLKQVYDLGHRRPFLGIAIP